MGRAYLLSNKFLALKDLIQRMQLSPQVPAICLQLLEDITVCVFVTLYAIFIFDVSRDASDSLCIQQIQSEQTGVSAPNQF